MAAWEWVLASAIGLALLLLVGYAIALVVRRQWISRHGGTFELSVRLRPGARTAAGSWVLGVGRYHDDRLEWFPIFSPLPRPARVWLRRELSYRGHRPAEGAERSVLYDGHVVVETATEDAAAQRRSAVEMAMSPNALTGLQAWLESGPPGGGRIGR